MKTNMHKGTCNKCSGPVFPQCGIFGKGGYLEHKPNHCFGRASLVQNKDLGNPAGYLTNGGKVSDGQLQQAEASLRDLRGCKGGCVMGAKDCCKVYARRVVRALGLKFMNDNEDEEQGAA
ncbi:hypothetical protein [Terasakiella sp.]|uniref:hypothetical protein n=1 Tax=Terasakiella sp. TaxID=2034861 RepID=UPI003AA80B5C